MLMRAYKTGARDAAEHFGVREASIGASIMDLLSSGAHYAPGLAATAAASKVIGALKGLGQDAARVAAPKAYGAVARPLARAGEIAGAPERLLRQHVVPAALGRTPEEVLLRGLSGAPSSAPLPAPTAIHGRAA